MGCRCEVGFGCDLDSDNAVRGEKPRRKPAERDRGDRPKPRQRSGANSFEKPTRRGRRGCAKRGEWALHDLGVEVVVAGAKHFSVKNDREHVGSTVCESGRQLLGSILSAREQDPLALEIVRKIREHPLGRTGRDDRDRQTFFSERGRGGGADRGDPASRDRLAKPIQQPRLFRETAHRDLAGENGEIRRTVELFDSLAKRLDRVTDLLDDFYGKRPRREGKRILPRPHDEGAGAHPRASAIKSAAPRARSLRATSRPRLSGSSAEPIPS